MLEESVLHSDKEKNKFVFVRIINTENGLAVTASALDEDKARKEALSQMEFLQNLWNLSLR